MRRSGFYIPSCERYVEADEYILWGTYTRERIIDIQYLPDEDGNWRYETIELEDFCIQRIMDRQTGATHAVLNEFFVPYKQHTFRFILFHLCQFFRQCITQEAYCLEAEIDVEEFHQWLKWLKDNITLLFGFGLTENYSDNWQAMSRWVPEIARDISDWAYNSLRKLNRALFQDRPMPEKTKYQKYDRSG